MVVIVASVWDEVSYDVGVIFADFLRDIFTYDADASRGLLGFSFCCKFFASRSELLGKMLTGGCFCGFLFFIVVLRYRCLESVIHVCSRVKLFFGSLFCLNFNGFDFLSILNL